jgi:hypothetical protein
LSKSRGLVLSVVLAIVLTGCTSPTSSIEASLSDAMESGRERVVIDLDSMVGGDWSSVVVVCRGVTEHEVSATLADLGATWPDLKSVASSSFLFTMLFVGNGEVVDVATTGSDSNWYFVPCLPQPHGTVEQFADVYAVPREDSVIEFTFDGSDPEHVYWYISAREALRLKAPRVTR